MALMAVGEEWQWTALPADYAHVIAESGLLRQSVRLKPAVPWAPEAARRAFSAMVAAVRARRIRAVVYARGYQAVRRPNNC